MTITTTINPDRALRSIETMCKRGYLTAPEFLGQLRPVLPGAVEIGCKVLGITPQRFRAKLYTKTIGAWDFFPQFMDEYAAWLRRGGNHEG